MVSVPFSRPKKNALAAVPYTRVIRLWAMLPSGSSCSVNCASTAAKSAASVLARPVTAVSGGADVPLMSWFHIRYSACVVVSPAACSTPSSRMNRITGGSAGAAGLGSSGANGSRPGALAQRQEFQHAQAERVREPAVPEQRADVAERQRGAGAEAERRW